MVHCAVICKNVLVLVNVAIIILTVPLRSALPSLTDTEDASETEAEKRGEEEFTGIKEQYVIFSV